eukprot:CAMPEP_0178456612 /NCGR_PEP_ID=MMETSP0689_2-20121128/46572_1 /TAXON_ID=160604 /ORGANISM="Amphidinium massartii, Strain CS-259" /LENGTH=36 /DNA_ID= /DNA_START= /DNA_END= /DNA_ORIENTATION=
MAFGMICVFMPTIATWSKASRACGSKSSLGNIRSNL